MGSGFDGNDFIKVGIRNPSRAYVASFGFKGSDQQKRAGVLSGGERNRLNLALTLKQGICCFWMSLPMTLISKPGKLGSGS